jgi:hypothetical protein
VSVTVVSLRIRRLWPTRARRTANLRDTPRAAQAPGTRTVRTPPLRRERCLARNSAENLMACEAASLPRPNVIVD